MSEYPTIVYSFGAKAREAADGLTDEVISALSAGEGPFEAVWDLCELAAANDPALHRWAAARDLRIVGLAPRAVKWLFHSAGAELPDSAEVLDPETLGANEIISRLREPVSPSPGPSGDPLPSRESSRRSGPVDALTVVLYEGPGAAPMPSRRLAELVCAAVAAGYRVTRPGRGAADFALDTTVAAVVGEFDNSAPAGLARGERDVVIDASGKCACGVAGAVDEARDRAGLPKPAAWVPWFPVIDYDLCVGCNQCANFCLFGVYTTDGGVRVVKPEACKTNCPACARMCPRAAIIFPYYASGPINGRPAPDDAPDQVDLKQALKGDVYEVLRNRSQGAAGGGDGAPSPAELARIAEKVEIPPQVLMSLGVSARAGKDACDCDCSGEAGPACGCDETAADGGRACECQCECDCSPGATPEPED